MHKITPLLLFSLITGVFSPTQAVEVGPFCQWHQDPCRTMTIQWIADRDPIVEPTQRWLTGPAGFGYGQDARTTLQDMKGNYRSLSMRQIFSVPDNAPAGAELVLALRYADGFVAYLDGKEVAREGVQKPADQPIQVQNKAAGEWEYFSLGPAKAGQQGLLAIVGYNDDLQSTDYSLNPRLEMQVGEQRVPLIPEGASWAYRKGEIPNRRWLRIPAVTELLATIPRFQFVYRPVDDSKWTSVKISNRPFSDTQFDVFAVDLEGLSPGTRYVFKRLRWGRVIDTCFFETAPDQFTDGLSFVTGGDMFHTRELLDSMNRRAGTEDPLFALLGGDLAYANGVDSNRWLEWVDSWAECAVSPDNRLIPMIVVIGNHEVKNAQYRPTNAPPKSDAPFFYSLFRGVSEGSKFAVDFGDYLSIVALDSGHTERITSQRDWLNHTLETRKGFPRQFVCYHRPAWGTGVKGNAVEIQKAWSPIFETYQVDAVFENDHHVYKRTHPLTNGKRDDKNGVIYMGDGSWGVATRPIASNWKTARPYLAHAESTNHLIKVIMHPSDFHYQALTANGEVIDESRRPRRR